jgi:hypothetical protein
MNEKRLKIITYGMVQAINTDRINNRYVSHDVVAELWMLPIDRFSDIDYELFHQVHEYVRYAYGFEELPDWYQEGDISEEW